MKTKLVYSNELSQVHFVAHLVMATIEQRTKHV